MRQLNGPLRVILLLLLASIHSALAQNDCSLPNETQFGETIARHFNDTVPPSVEVRDMVILCSSVRGDATILARYDCAGCEGIKETVFDLNCTDGVLTIKTEEQVDYDALTSTPRRDNCYDCVSPS